VFQLLRRDAESVMSTRFLALRAIGVRRRDVVFGAAFRGLAVGAAGAGAAAALAILLSPRAPIGLARVAEIDTGFHADGVVLIVAASLRLVAQRPDLGGGSWDAFISADDPARGPAIGEGIARSPLVDGWSAGGWQQLDAGGDFLYAEVLDPDSKLKPTIVRG